jgi:zeaxanthin glucosyltransferase
MTHFGILCPPSTGHLNPMTALGRELQRRGHCVTLFGIADAQSKALAAGLNFCMIGESQHPHGVSAQSLAKLGQLSGFAALQYTMSILNMLILTTGHPSYSLVVGCKTLLFLTPFSPFLAQMNCYFFSLIQMLSNIGV